PTSPDKKDDASANTPSAGTGMPANTQTLSDSEKCFDTSSLTDADYATAQVRSDLPCDRGPLPKQSPPAMQQAPWNVPNDNADRIQLAFNYASWLTFIGMNWPVSSTGAPDTSKQIGQEGDNLTVWETWKSSYEIFLPDGSDPGPWDQPRVPPQACAGKFTKGTPILQQLGKTPIGVVDEHQQPFKTGPLVDQQGRYVRFQILVNQPMFEYIRQNKLYNKAAQQNFGPALFPCGSNVLAANQFGTGPAVTQAVLGPIMVKAAWKLLEPTRDDASRFHTTEVLVYTPPSQDPKVEERCEPALAGLVGLHVVHKTASSPQWIWSSFEHVDNVPDKTDVANGKLKPRYNFYTPGCTQCTPVNEPPPKPWQPNQLAPPSQIVRELPIGTNDPAAPPVNALFQQKLRDISANSVWQFYELISAQWPAELPTTRCQIGRVDPTGEPIPQFLANSTLESYIQKPTPQTGSSCIACHNNATTWTAKHADFTYLLERAH
ncbi:MAG TPA: hypothetical protein VEU33_04035, partial [Archangium sp.]|nr:hypothetical protein [Archangium sp.]